MHASSDPRAAIVRGLPWLTAIVALGALAASLPEIAPSLQLERGGGAAEVGLRALGGHLTHWSADHLAWDLLVFVIVGVLCEVRSRSSFAATLIASAVAVSAVVLVEGTHLPYRGLSGIDAALVALLAVSVARDEIGNGRLAGLVEPVLLLLAIVGKSIYEQITGTTLFVDSTEARMLPVPLAHLAGAAAGAAVALLAPRQGSGLLPTGWRTATPARAPSYVSPQRKEAWSWTFAGKAWW